MFYVVDHIKHRLPRGGRSQLLQRALPLGAPARRGALHEQHRGGDREYPTRRVPPAPHRPRAGLHADRAHAAVAPRACGVDPVTADRLGRANGPGHGPRRRRHPRRAPASGAGLPRLSRTHATRTRAWRPASGSGVSARRVAALLSLSHGRTHSDQPAGSAAARRRGPCPPRPRPRERARRGLLRRTEGGDSC